MRHLTKEDVRRLKQKLEEEKDKLEKGLSSFAKKDKQVKGDWDAVYPHADTQSEPQNLEEAEDEVEAYANRVGIEHTLEKRLVKVNNALEKMDKGGYGICEKSGEEIPLERLDADPSATTLVER